MSALPTSLQPWRQWLDWFESEPAALLGDLLLRLNPLLGRSGARAQDGNIDHDGIDDLRQRGPYERLLLSEWALADSLPDEFVRRAANNEHLFFAPKLVNREADRVLLAVFDAGPAQWGAARLVHVALWIILARRAETMRARFLWGIAQAPGTLHEAGTPAALRKLLRGRTPEVASANHWQGWQEHFAASAQTGAERWLVASDHFAEAPFSHAACVHRGFDDQLRVSMGTRSGRRKTQLALPPARQAAWILRGDFLSEASTTAHQKMTGKLSLRQPPLWDVNCERVAVPLLGESRAVVFKVQEDSAAKHAKPRYMHWSTHAEVLSAVLSGKSFGALIADPYHLHFWNIRSFPAVKRPDADQFTITPGLPRWLSSAWLNSGSHVHRFLVLDNAGRLNAWLGSSRGKRGGEHVLVDGDVLTLTQQSSFRLLYVRHDQGHLLVNSMDTEGRTATITRLPVSDRPVSVTICAGTNARDWHGAVCVERRTGQRGGDRSIACTLFQYRGMNGLHQAELMLAPNSKVLGVARDMQEPEQFLVLALSPDRRTLLGVGARGIETLYRSAAEFSTGSVSNNGERVALVDLGGQLLVLGDGGRRLMMCVRGEQGSSDE
jgi:hypothetical protein